MLAGKEIKNLLETWGLGAPVDIRVFTCPECFHCTTQFYFTKPYVVTCVNNCPFMGFYSERSDRLFHADKKRAYPADVFLKHGFLTNDPMDSSAYKKEQKKDEIPCTE